MSAYDNVVTGKLKLKGKALDVKAGGVKKKKKQQKQYEQVPEAVEGVSGEVFSDSNKEDVTDVDKHAEDDRSAQDDTLTPAERRYMEQRERIDFHKLAKTSDKSHRDRIEDFNQYLANMSEHYDIPKVGPG